MTRLGTHGSASDVQKEEGEEDEEEEEVLMVGGYDSQVYKKQKTKCILVLFILFCLCVSPEIDGYQTLKLEL